MKRVVIGLAALLPLAGCGFSGPMNTEDRAALDTCRSDAERQFNAQHREQLSQRDSTDSPFSGDSLPSDPNRGLSDRYEHEQMVDHCLHANAGPVQPEIPMTDVPAAGEK
jgi:predicted small lipoprotein YifL